MAIWIAMQADDLDQVMTLSEAAHPGLPEHRSTHAQRLHIYPRGCLVLSERGVIHGYAFAHPITHATPPALNKAPEHIAHAADELYLHDFVICSSMRGRGYAPQGIDRLLRLGDAFASMALISVYGTAGFWGKFGFIASTAVPSEKLASYGPDAIYMVRSKPAATALP